MSKRVSFAQAEVDFVRSALGAPLSTNVSGTSGQAVAKRVGARLDGRPLTGLRPCVFRFLESPVSALTGGSVEVTFAEATDGAGSASPSRVLAVCSAVLREPYPERPSEGMFSLAMELSPMANPAFEHGRAPTSRATEITRVVERTLRESGAVDTEALCVITGELVWQLKCDVTVLDDGGNLLDCVSVAAAAALLSLRRPEVSVEGGVAAVHSPLDRPPVPLAIHHLPLCVTVAVYGDPRYRGAADAGVTGRLAMEEAAAVAAASPLGAPPSTSSSKGDWATELRGSTAGGQAEPGFVFVLDPSTAEEQAADGFVTVACNVHNELCLVHKSGGLALPPGLLAETVRRASAAALARARELDRALRSQGIVATAVTSYSGQSSSSVTSLPDRSQRKKRKGAPPEPEPPSEVGTERVVVPVKVETPPPVKENVSVVTMAGLVAGSSITSATLSKWNIKR